MTSFDAIRQQQSNSLAVLLSCHLLPVQCTQFIRSRAAAGTAGDAAELNNNTVEAPPPTNLYPTATNLCQHRIQGESFLLYQDKVRALWISIHNTISSS